MPVKEEKMLFSALKELLLSFIIDPKLYSNSDPLPQKTEIVHKIVRSVEVKRLGTT